MELLFSGIRLGLGLTLENGACKHTRFDPAGQRNLLCGIEQWGAGDSVQVEADRVLSINAIGGTNPGLGVHVLRLSPSDWLTPISTPEGIECHPSSAEECLQSWAKAEDQTVVLHSCAVQPFHGRRVRGGPSLCHRSRGATIGTRS